MLTIGRPLAERCIAGLIHGVEIGHDLAHCENKSVLAPFFPFPFLPPHQTASMFQSPSFLGVCCESSFFTSLFARGLADCNPDRARKGN